MEIRFILNDSEDTKDVTPINTAYSIIKYALQHLPTNSDIEFIRQVSEHLEVFWKGHEREYNARMEEVTEFYE